MIHGGRLPAGLRPAPHDRRSALHRGRPPFRLSWLWWPVLVLALVVAVGPSGAAADPATPPTTRVKPEKEREPKPSDTRPPLTATTTAAPATTTTAAPPPTTTSPPPTTRTTVRPPATSTTVAPTTATTRASASGSPGTATQVQGVQIVAVPQDTDAAASMPATAPAAARSPSSPAGALAGRAPSTPAAATVTRTITRTPSVFGRRVLQSGPRPTTATPATPAPPATSPTPEAPTQAASTEVASAAGPTATTTSGPIVASRSSVGRDPGPGISPTLVALIVALSLAALAVVIDRRRPG